MDTPWGFSPPPVPVPVPVPKPVQVPRRVQGGTPLVSVGETHEYPMSFFFTAAHCNDPRPSHAANDISEFAREANPEQGWEPLHRAVKTVNPSARFARVLTALNRQREENRT